MKCDFSVKYNLIEGFWHVSNSEFACINKDGEASYVFKCFSERQEAVDAFNLWMMKQGRAPEFIKSKEMKI